MSETDEQFVERMAQTHTIASREEFDRLVALTRRRTAMSDIVERLRALETCETELAHEGDCPPEATANWKYAETCRLAAAEIERLRAALREIASYDEGPKVTSGFDEPISTRIARAALEGTHMSDLRERVARAMRRLDETSSTANDVTWHDLADAAIAIIRGETLEEAARCYEQGDDWDTFSAAAAAIRALKDKP